MHHDVWLSLTGFPSLVSVMGPYGCGRFGPSVIPWSTPNKLLQMDGIDDVAHAHVLAMFQDL